MSGALAASSPARGRQKSSDVTGRTPYGCLPQRNGGNGPPLRTCAMKCSRAHARVSGVRPVPSMPIMLREEVTPRRLPQRGVHAAQIDFVSIAAATDAGEHRRDVGTRQAQRSAEALARSTAHRASRRLHRTRSRNCARVPCPRRHSPSARPTCCSKACRSAGTPGRRCSVARRAARRVASRLHSPSRPRPPRARTGFRCAAARFAALSGMRSPMPAASASSKSTIQRMPASTAGWSPGISGAVSASTCGSGPTARSGRMSRPATAAMTRPAGLHDRDPAIGQQPRLRRAPPRRILALFHDIDAREARFGVDAVPATSRHVRRPQQPRDPRGTLRIVSIRELPPRILLRLRVVARAPYLRPVVLAPGLLGWRQLGLVRIDVNPVRVHAHAQLAAAVRLREEARFEPHRETARAADPPCTAR